MATATGRQQKHPSSLLNQQNHRIAKIIMARRKERKQNKTRRQDWIIIFEQGKAKKNTNRINETPGICRLVHQSKLPDTLTLADIHKVRIRTQLSTP
jgi:hypothetical protein